MSVNREVFFLYSRGSTFLISDKEQDISNILIQNEHQRPSLP